MWVTIILCITCCFLIRENWKTRAKIRELNDEMKNRWSLMDSNAEKINETFKDINKEIKKLSDAFFGLENKFESFDISGIVKNLERKILQNTQNIQNVFKLRNFRSIIDGIKKDVRKNKTKVDSRKS